MLGSPASTTVNSRGLPRLHSVSSRSWNGYEAQQGQITTPFLRRLEYSAIFLEPQHSLGIPWLTRSLSATHAFTHQTERLCLVSCPSERVYFRDHTIRRAAISSAACRSARYTAVVAAIFEKSVLDGRTCGQAIRGSYRRIARYFIRPCSRVPSRPSPNLRAPAVLGLACRPQLPAIKAIVRLATVSPICLSFVFVTRQKVAAEAFHAFHLSCLSPVHTSRCLRPSVKPAYLTAAWWCIVWAPASRYPCVTLIPVSHGYGYPALLSLLQASSAYFSCLLNRQTHVR